MLTFCLQVLEELEKQHSAREEGDAQGAGVTALPRQVTAVFNRVLAIIEQVLTWDFLPKQRILPHLIFTRSFTCVLNSMVI